MAGGAETEEEAIREEDSLVLLELIARSEELLYSLGHGTDKNHPSKIPKRICGQTHLLSDLGLGRRAINGVQTLLALFRSS